MLHEGNVQIIIMRFGKVSSIRWIFINSFRGRSEAQYYSLVGVVEAIDEYIEKKGVFLWITL